MKTYIYQLITKGSDERFIISAFSDIDVAQKMLETNVAAQKDIEESCGSQVYIDYHKYERLRFPEFVMRDEDIISHVTVNVAANFDGKDRICKTERYIVRTSIN